MTRSPHSSYDAVIAGGGHNGLVAAAYLARAGRSVLLLERRDELGGAAVSETAHPPLEVAGRRLKTTGWPVAVAFPLAFTIAL